jgi:peptidoglycan/xylan/chitin deacetylase (PgdA/CDA1 family)
MCVTVAAIDLGIGHAPGWPELFLFILSALLLIYGIFSLRSQALGPAFCGLHGISDPVVALTFDDGPDPDTTPRILAALGDAPATFFVVGERARAHPDLIDAIRSRGHAIRSHGERHAWQALMTTKRTHDLITQGDRSLKELGIDGGTFFRPPFGLVTPPLLTVARELHLVLVGWTLRSWDTIHPGPPEPFAKRLAARVRNGDIVLLHDSSYRPGGSQPLVVHAVGPLISALKTRGFRMITIDQLFRDREEA